MSTLRTDTLEDVASTVSIDVVDIVTGINNAAGLRQELSEDGGSGIVGFDSSEVYPVGTVGNRLSKYITVTDSPYNAVADGVTDSTAAVLSAGIAAGPRGAIFIPPMVKYSPESIQSDPTMPAEVVVFDNSLINGGYDKAKVSTVYSRSLPDSTADFTTVFSDGHNAGIALDNTGEAGSAGSALRNVGISWTGGRLGKGAIPEFLRSIAREEFTGTGAHWSKTLRKRAPWEAVSAKYFRWAENTIVEAVGEYCFSNNKYYVSTGVGTTGSIPPSHTTGTATDGGVSWTFVQFSYDQGVYSINDLGRIAINSALGSNFRRDRMSVDDTGDMVYSHESVGASKNILFNFLPTDASSVSTGVKQISASPTGFTFTVDTNIAGAFLTSGFNQRGVVKLSTTATASDTTPSVANIGTLILNNGSSTSITTLDDGVANQEVVLIFQTALTTLVNSANFKLQGSVNVTPTADSVITMRRVPYSSIWVEVSRSIK